MASRDPFPMSSPEAQNMAAHVGQAPAGEWNSMGFNSGASLSTAAMTNQPANTDATEGLVSGRKTAGSDIYEDQDENKANQNDNFLDRPLWEVRETSPWRRNTMKCLRFLEENLYKRLYGDNLPISEMARTLCLASTLFFMIGGYWLLRSLKDPVLTSLCGVGAIPKAKMLSVFVVLGVVTVYNRFLDSSIPRHHLFYIFGSVYSALFFIVAVLLTHPTIGLPNQQPSPTRLLGWISYCGIESFGSVMVSLFWSFANSNFTLETAKASYGVVVATAQVGSILGPTFVKRYVTTLGLARCYIIGALCMVLLQGTMFTYISIYGAAERNASVGTKKVKAGVMEGIELFIKHNYVKGIFAISCLFMVEVTIVDFTLKKLGSEYFALEHPCQDGMSCYNAETGEHGMSEDATAAFTAFIGFFGQATNTLSFLLSLLGTSFVIRFLGLRLTLLLFPSLCLAVICFVRVRPTLYVVFGAMMVLKACSYSLNNPTKEMLYQPTSSAVRYKAKSWIDIFGARGSKAFGSVITNAFAHNTSSLIANGSLVGIAVSSFLIWNAYYMGGKFDEYTETGYIVGAEPEEEKDDITGYARADIKDKNLEMTQKQNEEGQDTSCAIYDDNQTGIEEEGQQGEKGASGEAKPEVQMV